ncbi:MAG TPA: hypothetical protein VHN59_04920 [Chitinophagaceae bacterium]|nr:hypothetical protein [Chitinophagaceae bacterium]
MSLLRYIRKMQQLDGFIKRKSTGNQLSFAEKTGMSKSMLNEYLKEMKELGFPIKYCRKRNSYFYERDGCLVKSLFEMKTDKADLNKIQE